MAAVLVASFGAFLAFTDTTVVNVAFPNLEAAFPHATVGDLSWILNTYSIVFAGMLVVGGRVADLVGRRRIFKVGLLLFTVASGLCAAANSVEMLIVFRALQGAGAAMLVPASLGVVVHASPVERRSHALSLWAAAAALAAGLGPPLGGWLVDLYNWRLVFLINLPLGLLAWLFTRRVVIESRAPGRRLMPDLRGALMLSIALAALTLGIVEGSMWGWHSPPTLIAFIVAALGLAATVRSSTRHQSPILDPALLRIRGFAVSNLVTLAVGLGLYTYLLTHILWLHYVWGYSLLLAGLAVAPGAVVAAISSGPFGKLADRFGPRVVMVPGALIWAGAYVWYAARVGLHPDFLGQWLPGQVLSGIGVGATLPVATSGGLRSVPARRYATASAINASARQLGGVLAIALLTIFIAHPSAGSLPSELRYGWELAAGSFAAAAFIGLLFGPVRSADDHSDSSSRTPLVATGRAPTLVSTAADPSPTDFLGLLPSVIREEILDVGDVGHLRAGEILFRAGEQGDTLFALRSGRLEVRLSDGSVRALSPGAVVGELALLTEAPRSATVVARRDSTVVAISRDQLEHLALERPAVAHAVAKGVANMLKESRPLRSPAPPTPKVIGLVALDADVPIAALGDALHEQLTTAGGGCRIARLDAPGAGSLDQAEQDSDRVLLVAGSDSAWRESCIRQADSSSRPSDPILAGLAPSETGRTSS